MFTIGDVYVDPNRKKNYENVDLEFTDDNTDVYLSCSFLHRGNMMIVGGHS